MLFLASGGPSVTRRLRAATSSSVKRQVRKLWKVRKSARMVREGETRFTCIFARKRYVHGAVVMVLGSSFCPVRWGYMLS